MMGFAYEDYTTLETIRRPAASRRTRTGPRAAGRSPRRRRSRELGSKYFMMHVGFLDHTDKAYAEKFYGRVRALGDSAGEAGVALLMETGQETAEDLQRFVETLNHPNVLLNFDPANLILYNKDEPLSAVRRLAPWIRHVHIKDALRTAVPGAWGSESCGRGSGQRLRFPQRAARRGLRGRGRGRARGGRSAGARHRELRCGGCWRIETVRTAARATESGTSGQSAVPDFFAGRAIKPGRRRW
jgi:sugar phosphate isomerase/epimerase